MTPGPDLDRRRFLQVGVAATAAAGLAACGGDSGGLPEDGIVVGPVDEVRELIRAGGGTHLVPDARAYLVEVPAEHRAALAAEWGGPVGAGIQVGFLALSQKCPHQGCRVSPCEQSGWFECPCHGSRFTRMGELRKGPAPRGLDAFAVEVTDGRLRLVGAPVTGLSDDVDVSGEPDPGRHCV